MILEYQTKSTLNPALWENGNLKPKLRDGFLKIAERFTEFLDVEAEVYDIILIGSNANYNWTANSDIDIHLIINYAEVGENLHLVRNYMMAKKSLWNQKYPLTYKGMDIELFAQDANQELHKSVGEYSVMHNKWIRRPDANTVSIDDSIIDQKMQPLAYEIDNLDQNTPNLESRIKHVLQKLYKMRQTGLEAEGEYAIENLAFKKLRSTGRLSRLKELLQKYEFQTMSLTESRDVESMLRNHLHTDKKMNQTDWQFLVKHMDTIVDDRGQWDHPGKCTLISNNNITMKDVKYPVFGFDETGYSEIMQPEQNYKFPGTVVFEIPMNKPEYQSLVKQIHKV